MTANQIFEIAGNFQVSGTPVAFKECNAGHINSTYVVDFKTDNNTTDKYILQKINTYVFRDVDSLMNNIIGVTGYLSDVLKKSGGDTERGTLRFVPSFTGKCYHHTGKNEYWRMYHYVDNVISYSLADSPKLFERAGYAFGNFQKLLADYDASGLNETIPDFHNTKKRFDRFTEVLSGAPEDRRRKSLKEIDFVLSHESTCSLIVDEIAAGRIPVRVTHNDTKLNNILMDEKTGDAVCIIDLDTIMPGSILYDFGDAIRFGASNALEDEKNLDKVFFRNNMFEAFAKGYISGCDGSLTQREIKMLPTGADVITLETGIRFLTDYLENDVYFKVDYPDHNLVRAKNQFKLVSDIENRMDEFDAIIKKYL